MLKEQGGVCKLCGNNNVWKTDRSFQKNFHVDHDHETGGIRGLLCGRCNMAIGLFEDDPDLLLRARDYIISYIKV